MTDQAKSGLTGQSLQMFLDSATNAIDKGQAQYFTPEPVANELIRFINPYGQTQIVLDPLAGDGSMLNATQSVTKLGIELDGRFAKPLRNNPEFPTGKTTITHADYTLWQELAGKIEMRFPLIVTNPPFGLQWHGKRFDWLRSGSPYTQAAYNKLRGKNTIDSTAATFLSTLELTAGTDGRAMMICNDDTARRLFGDPENPTADSLLHPIFLWMTINGSVFPNVKSGLKTAVIYFSRCHGQRRWNLPQKTPNIKHLTLNSSDPQIIRNGLDSLQAGCFDLMEGGYRTYTDPTAEIVRQMTCIEQEYKRRYESEIDPPFHIKLGINGRITRNLSTYDHMGGISREALTRLNALQDKTPLQLSVQNNTRKELQWAVKWTGWRVDPKLIKAVAEAVKAYESERAPFYTPNPVQSLGWVDEEESLECCKDGLEACESGKSYPIQTSTEELVDTIQRFNTSTSTTDDIEANSQELVITVCCGSQGTESHPDIEHKFHVRRASNIPEDVQTSHRNGRRVSIHHHVIDALLAHFIIPIPEDRTALMPEEFKNNLNLIDHLQGQINTNLATA